VTFKVLSVTVTFSDSSRPIFRKSLHIIPRMRLPTHKKSYELLFLPCYCITRYSLQQFCLSVETAERKVALDPYFIVFSGFRVPQNGTSLRGVFHFACRKLSQTRTTSLQTPIVVNHHELLVSFDDESDRIAVAAVLFHRTTYCMQARFMLWQFCLSV